MNIVQVMDFLTNKGASKDEVLEVGPAAAAPPSICAYCWLPSSSSSSVKWTGRERG